MLEKLRKLANILYWAATAVLIALPIAAVGYLLTETPSPSRASALFPHIDIIASPTGTMFWSAFSVGALSFLLFIGFLWSLRGLFDFYRKGQILTLQAAGAILRLGKWLIALALVRFMTLPIQTLLLTSNNPDGHRQLAISISDHEVGFLLAAGLLTLIGWAMNEAVRISDENKAFV